MNDSPLFRHGWLIAIAFNVFNAFALRARARTYILQKPELAGGYQRLFKGFLFWWSLPWIVMGIGIEWGGVPSIFSYFRPRDGNPFVVGWFAVIAVEWILGFYWLFARRGAEFLIEHPGLLRGPSQSPATIRLFYCLMVAGGVLGLIFLFVMDIPGTIK
ncbi:MAG: hypothetical protein ABJF10_14230 [Chthoniobacter sp.]|uniref:hypothetical protein n=1 Tax=Chthoniobacter sp. TaxID=2510640 RepID=UPI0032AE1980